MTPLKVFSFFLFSLFSLSAAAQYTLSGRIISAETGNPVPDAEIYNRSTGNVFTADENGEFFIESLPGGTYDLTVFSYQYEVLEEQIDLTEDEEVVFQLAPLAETLSEVMLIQRRKEIFALRNLKKVEGTAIYAGKKSEVILMEEIVGNLAANNARQIYNRVVGLNIYSNADAGLQLNIGGRGLNPNRTQNFNTRQNGYDISADVLGYPESYYTPPAEALSEIQVIRGAASLQYGTQFGGLINFKFREPNPYEKIELITRQTVGSHDLFTSFNSLSGTLGKFSYYTYYNYKTGNGFRPNSGYESHNAFAHLGWEFTDATRLSFEYTFLDYLAQQPGGLTDAQFYENPDYSNRTRNWFDVNWNLWALKLEHSFSPQTDFTLNFFGLDASRKAVGYRENRVSQADNDPSVPRELLVDHFSNWGAEARLLTRYKLLDEESVLLLGSKYYTAENEQRQGPGTAASGPDFDFASEQFPDYRRQSDFIFPNRNLAFFGENIFSLTRRFSVTPGFRFEYINTQSQGSYKRIEKDLADNILLNETLEDNREFERSFVLFGLGASYDLETAEFYGNISQNYRSVTFNDIRVVNPVFQVDPNISDEEGYTADIGVRGRWRDIISYDVSAFALGYNGRIGEVLKPEIKLNAQGELEETGRLIRFRGNIGDAVIYGVETFADWNLKNTFFEAADHFIAGAFINAAYTTSEYLRSEENNVVGKQVEFIPAVNLKTGVDFGFRNLLGSLQYTYLSEQFTDATNAPQIRSDSQRGIEGSIPAYGIVDFSLSYTYRMFRLETGVNNVLNNSYFTRRATGYPGPGIIPAEPVTWYTTLQLKL